MPIRKRWAFLVGINRYVEYGTLSYCVDDVLALKQVLTAADYTVVSLHDRLDRDSPRYPTNDNIRAELKFLCDGIKTGENQGQDDLLLVYFACHGTREPDGQPRLIGRDTRKALLVERVISIADVEQAMADSGAGCRVLMLDACHIGLGKANTRAPEDPELLRKIHDLARGYALIAASTDQQDAHEWDGVKHGIFSFYVLSGLSGKADLHGKNYVTVKDLSGYILKELQDWRVRHGVDQVPLGRVEGNLGDFILIDKYQALQQSMPAIETGQSEPVLSSQGLQPRGRSSGQVIDYLWSLDCATQRQSFKDNTPRSPRAAAFIVQTKDSRIQQWLVKLLVNEIPDVANAKAFPFIVPAHPMWKNHDFGEFWRDLSGRLGCREEPTAVIEALVQIYRTKPIIIAMYRWSGRSRSQALQQQVLDEFWQPLVEAVRALGKQPPRSRIILFFAEGPRSLTVGTQAQVRPNPCTPVRLAPLTDISRNCVATWLERDPVFPVLRQLVDEERQLNELIDREIDDWGSDPVDVIEQICYILGLENGIADIEAGWRLAG